MAITKINTPELLDINTTGAKQLPSGTTAQRPTTGLTAGDFRYNTDDDRVEYYDGAAWFQIDDEALPVACTTDTINYPSGTTNTAYYKMSDATDSTLNGYNGTATSVDFNVQGKFGNAGSFNGSSSVIDISASAGFPSSVYTVSMWLKINDVTAYKGFFLNVSSSNLTNQIGVVLNSGRIDVYSVVSNNNNTLDKIETTPQTAFVNNTWYNVVIIADRSLTNKVQVFVDNTENTYNYVPNSSGTTGYSTAKIGFADGNYFNGSIDQVRIFASALTAANVTSLYNEVQCVPAIIPSDYFNPLLYTGNSSTQSIDDLTFAPDLIWIKERSGTDRHVLIDTIRGTNSQLSSNDANAETTYSSNLVSFDTNGFTLGSASETNGSNETYVAWNWKSGGAPTATNSAGAGNVPTAGSVKIDGADSTTALAGTIAATNISANTDAGFSIVSYTGNAGNGSIGHGLNNTVELVLIKKISASESWIVWYEGAGTTNFLELNGATATQTGAGWGGVPTSSIVHLQNGGAGRSNAAANYIAYCFHSVDGYSKIGSYVGGGATDVPITLGFSPAFVIIKNATDGGGSDGWVMYDNKRQPGTVPYDNYNILYANYDLAEQSDQLQRGIQFTSNGFVANQNYNPTNGSGDTLIFLAIAEEVYNANAVTANQTNPFNDGSQIAQYEFEDNADDSQPNGYIGKGGTFNGSSSVIDIPLNVVSPASAYTVSLWFNCNDITVNQGIFTNIGTSTQAGEIAINITGSNQISIYSATGTSNNVNILNVTPSTSLSNDTWFNLVVISDRNLSDRGRVFINGTEEAISYAAGPGSNAQYSTAKIGVSDNRYFDGSIDQVRIYNTALNPNDAWLLYSETSATSSTLDYPASKGAIALYELEGDATSTSSSTYDGTDTAVAWVPLYDGTENSMTYAAPSVSAPFLKAGEFNGSNGDIDLPSGIESTTMSISFWIYIDSIVTGNEVVIELENGYGVWFLSSASGKLGVQNQNANNQATLSNSQLSAGAWHHVAAVWTGVGGIENRTFYLDNVVQTGGTVNDYLTCNGNTIGSRGTGEFFDGKLDQVRIFNKALDAGEVLQLYNEPNN
ncbi:LamG domain-containing protein [Flavobacteriaceae bacterium]|nr:LamG domain-containing protein [Flavobacteriaceae bacterium]